ncbi:MAG: UxaA family hydrolase, partial [Methylophilaceae bacterium]
MNSTFAAAENKLASLDQDWRSLLAEVGSCTLQPKQQSPYESLIRAVASQQLHSKAANAILARMLVMFDNQFPSPEQLTASDGEALRNCGFSRGKVATLQGIAAAALSGQVPDLSEAMEMTDWQLIQRLTALKGIGQWTVEMMLIFNLGRQDVLPVDVLAEGDRARFMGFVREDGRVGTRNFIGILSSVNCSATVIRKIAQHFTPERLKDFPNVDGVAAFP